MLRFRTLVLLAIAMIASLSAAHAETPGRHPFYVHALSDLRTAHWLVNRPAEWNVARDQQAAEREINAAYSQLKRAAIDDRKDYDDRVSIDANLNRQGRLQKAETLLQTVLNDINRPEDNRDARRWRDAARVHAERALYYIRRARHDAQWDRAHGF